MHVLGREKRVEWNTGWDNGLSQAVYISKQPAGRSEPQNLVYLREMGCGHLCNRRFPIPARASLGGWILTSDRSSPTPPAACFTWDELVNSKMAEDDIEPAYVGLNGTTVISNDALK